MNYCFVYHQKRRAKSEVLYFELCGLGVSGVRSPRQMKHTSQRQRLVIALLTDGPHKPPLLHRSPKLFRFSHHKSKQVLSEAIKSFPANEKRRAEILSAKILVSLRFHVPLFHTPSRRSVAVIFQILTIWLIFIIFT